MIVVAGEALIDLIVYPDGRLSAVSGGGPFNTARTIGRLGVEVAFLGRLSTDRFGGILAAALSDDGVDLRWAVRTEAPTTLAVAELDEGGAASYRFHLAETSAPGLTLEDTLAVIRSEPGAIHVGTLGLVVEPMATALAAAVARADAGTFVMVDPNCRPRVIVDREAYLARLRGIMGRADVVKVSADDLSYLVPDATPLDAARTLVADGARTILLTDGGCPVTVLSEAFAFELPVPAVRIVDTVGSGDAFGGAFLARWTEQGWGRQELADADALRDAVTLAIDVASLTCQRAGADPPRRAELGRTSG
ncbi:MAG: PfkB family carbohydrate kinase [Chloroflexota bacterium]